MLRDVRDDLRRISSTPELGVRGMAHLLFHRPGLQAVVAYRLARSAREGGGSPAPWRKALFARPASALLTRLVRLVVDVELAPDADIGPGLKLHHFGGIRVRGCRLGADCVIHQRARVEPDADGRGPDIGDRVWIGPHARIIGPVRVGDGATIAAGAVVTQDVEPGTLVVGNPARATMFRYDNQSLRES